MAYLIWELEICPTTGTPHVQGYVRFNNRMRFNQLQALLPHGAHIEPARDPEHVNKAYCSKDRRGDDWGEFGNYIPEMRQGRRSDLSRVAEQVQQGTSMREIAEAYPEQWIRYHAGIESLRRKLQPVPPTKRTITTIWLWGVSGVGKTHRIMMSYPDIYVTADGPDPFGDYAGEKEILMDEFSDQDLTIRAMNKYLGGFRTPIRSRYWNKTPLWEKVFITSNAAPETFYSMEPPELRTAFFRRISSIIEIKDRNQELLLL